MKWNIPLKMLKNTQQNIKTKEQEESNRVLFLEQARHLAVHALLTTLTSAQLKLKGRNIEERQATCNSPTSNKKRRIGSASISRPAIADQAPSPGTGATSSPRRPHSQR